ncbi:MAG: DUF5677 domain-containing protein [Terracidiphilus sp.]
MTKKEKCIERIRDGLKQLASTKADYAVRQDKQDVILLHFIERAEQIVQAALLIDTLETPLQILCRVFCEDFFLTCWISQSTEAADEYEAGVAAEIAKMMRVSLTNGWGVIRDRHTKAPVGEEFMKTEFLPKLKTLKTPRTNVEQIAQKLGLQKLYDILYRGASLDLHGNTFGLPEHPDEGGDYAALSAIDAILACLVILLELPRKPYVARPILVRMRLEREPSTQ